MQQTVTEQAPGKGGGPREERWRIAVLLVVALAIAAFVFTLRGKAPLNGRIDPASHVAAKSKQQEAREKEEIARRFKQGVAMLHAGEYEHALTAFHQVLTLAPEMPEAHVNAGYALLGLKRPKAALDFFISATELRADQLNAYFGMAEALSELGDYAAALQAMETYFHLAPKDDPFRRKAEAANWELRTKIEEQKAKQAAESGRNAPDTKPGGKR